MAENEESQSEGRTYTTVGPTGLQVGRGIAAARNAKQMTTEDLAAALTDAGVPFKASTITKVEKGRRRLTVDELVALAVVLDVNPSALMLPVEVDRERPVEITGYGEVKAERAWQWIDGHKALPGRASRAQAEAFDKAVRPWWGRAHVMLPGDLARFAGPGHTLTADSLDTLIKMARPLRYDEPEQTAEEEPQ